MKEYAECMYDSKEYKISKVPILCIIINRENYFLSGFFFLNFIYKFMNLHKNLQSSYNNIS